MSRPGGVYFSSPAADAAACAAQCADDRLCMAWTYRPSTELKACELKAVAPPAVQDASATSGVADRAAEFLALLAGKDPSVAPVEMAEAAEPPQAVDIPLDFDAAATFKTALAMPSPGALTLAALAPAEAPTLIEPTFDFAISDPIDVAIPLALLAEAPLPPLTAATEFAFAPDPEPALQFALSIPPHQIQPIAAQERWQLLSLDAPQAGEPYQDPVHLAVAPTLETLAQQHAAPLSLASLRQPLISASFEPVPTPPASIAIERGPAMMPLPPLLIPPAHTESPLIITASFILPEADGFAPPALAQLANLQPTSAFVAQETVAAPFSLAAQPAPATALKQVKAAAKVAIPAEESVAPPGLDLTALALSLGMTPETPDDSKLLGGF